MKKILFILTIAALSLISCNNRQEPDYSVMAEPTIELMYESVTPDMNRVDNTPIVCVIFSEAGLKSVSLYKTESGEESLVKEITSFRDPNQYSMKESIPWNVNITSVKIVAFDKADRKAEAELPVEVTPVQPAPVITFGMEKIQIEVLQNLDQVTPAGAILLAAWPRIEGATGLPARVWAITE